MLDVGENIIFALGPAEWLGRGVVANDSPLGWRQIETAHLLHTKTDWTKV